MVGQRRLLERLVETVFDLVGRTDLGVARGH
jgi:hypothetical protein